MHQTLKEIHSPYTARLIGLFAHFSYWLLFTPVNTLPIDTFHLKQIFVSILHSLAQFEMKHVKNKLFANFVMPMLLLSVRIQIEGVFKQNYPKFMAEEEKDVMRLVNGAITEIVDPKMYYSRFSFLESGKEAIDLKAQLSKQMD